MSMSTSQDIRRDVNAAAADLKQSAQQARAEEASNPASLSGDRNKKVPINKPNVKPPLIDIPFGRFLTYLVVGLTLLSLYYVWRFQRFANEVGGYWNAVTGARGADLAAVAADKAAESAASVAKGNAGAASATGGSKPLAKGKNVKGDAKKGGKEDVQAQVLRLAQTLGVKPADLSDAIRHLIDPTAPKPSYAEAGKQAQVQAEAAAAAASSAAASDEPGIFDIMGEVLLD